MRKSLIAIITGGLLAALYAVLLRRWVVNWGATETEVAARLPGDELLDPADGVATRAITIDAPAAMVWPWLAQMGPAPRGGAYTYDWIENLLGLGFRSVDEILPQFQHPQPGEEVNLGARVMRFEIVEPQRALAWRARDGGWVWSFVLEQWDDRTRLVSRNRYRIGSAGERAVFFLMEPASLVMERKMLLGIKQRAERLAARESRAADARRAGRDGAAN